MVLRYFYTLPMPRIVSTSRPLRCGTYVGDELGVLYGESAAGDVAYGVPEALGVWCGVPTATAEGLSALDAYSFMSARRAELP